MRCRPKLGVMRVASSESTLAHARALQEPAVAGCEASKGRSSTPGRMCVESSVGTSVTARCDERGYAIKPLDASTWDAFARLAEKHNGMGFGGCWCTWCHSRVGRPEGEKGRPWKERLVREGEARAALVFDRDAAVAWCQYGSPDELPIRTHRARRSRPSFSTTLRAASTNRPASPIFALRARTIA